MSNSTRLCLNMIVKNETANLERCLAAVAPHIQCWVIGDTGSTDGTQDFILKFFAERGIPGELHSFPFVNFAQARNAALDHAYASELAWDYLLLADADMELVVEDPDFGKKLEAPCYDLLQRAGISYWNRRLVRRDAGARYHGVTHEYLGVEGGGSRLHGVWYKDHASGSNRVDKFERDIRLLTAALAEEPEHQRYWFYLAQSYRDAGRLLEAAEAYSKRAGMGGWEEEAWYATLQEARCLRDLGDEGGFVRQALAAFSRRPHRAEPLYDLARYHRERGRNEAAALFAEQGLALGRPDGDALFVEDHVYEWGLREELSIAANYSPAPARKACGHAACKWLAANPDIPEGPRNLAQNNLQFYPEPVIEEAPPPDTDTTATAGEEEPAADPAADGEPVPAAPQIIKRAAPLVFIHAAPRTSSTWFWSRFREHSSTLCYYEPFNSVLAEITPETASDFDRTSWLSRHSPTEPYYREYLPLLRQAGGVELFDRSMICERFPLGGLRGSLRPNEKDYLSLLVRHAKEAGKIPVFKEIYSLARCWATKQAIGGFHILLHRNLWQQWTSYLSYMRIGHLGLYLNVVDTVYRGGDPYFLYLVERGLERAAEWEASGHPAAPTAERQLPADFRPEDEARLRRLESLPEPHAFALFMGLYVYLSLHAQISTDLTVDVTRMARDDGYRRDIERAIERHTGLSISLADVEDVAPQGNVSVDVAAIDWDEIKKDAGVAVQMLSVFGDPRRLTENATYLIEGTIEEMRRSEAALAAPSIGARIAKAEATPPDPDSPRSWFDWAQTERAVGRFAEAAKAYARRAQMDGDPDEIWYARLQEARCLRDLGDGGGFMSRMLELFNQHPDRAEPLYDLARFHRERGMHETAMHFAETGIALARPQDNSEFVEDFVYQWGFQEEVSISGFYCRDPARKERGAAACNWLALNGDVPADRRGLAQENLRFYGEPRPTAEPLIPRIFHFITGLDENFGGKPFSFIHYMAIRSALAVNEGFRAKVYYHYEPRGEYWDAIKNDVELVRVQLPHEVFGNPVGNFAHKADVLRLRILLEQGGVYLDLDTICQRPFAPLLDGRVVMGREERVLDDGSVVTVGLCNATIIAPPNAEFLRLWYEKYREFNTGDWNKFSVKVPMALAEERPELLRIEPAASFFWPSWDPAGIAAMFSLDREFPDAFSFHLWEAATWHLVKDLDRNAVMTVGTTYNRIARRFVNPGNRRHKREERPPKGASSGASHGKGRAGSAWVPDRQAAGTELMVGGLRQRLGRELDRVNLKVMGFDKLEHAGDRRPQIVWMHHDVNQEWVQWCKDKTLVDLVDGFVFVSCWQREQYLKAFGLPPERCVVLRNATEVGSSPRPWEPAPVWRCAYTSTPFRGLSVLLDAWERLSPGNAELHIWSSMKLYLGDDGPYNHLYQRAQSMPGVIYHGIVPNPELCAALRDMHFLVYPSTFAETSCLAVIEAMAAGCRVIVPSLGALPETTGGYARVYPNELDANRHAEVFANVLAYEISNPWAGATDLSMAQQRYCAETFDWDHRAREWRQLIAGLCGDIGPGSSLVVAAAASFREETIAPDGAS